MDRGAIASISVQAVQGNIRALRRHIGRKVKLCAVVKADAYGHGLPLLAPVLAEQVDWFAVATPEEALRLHALNCSKPILLFSPATAFQDEEDGLYSVVEDLARRKIVFTIVDATNLAVLEAVARKTGMPVNVHVKIDSGMGRSGISAENAPALVSQVLSSPVIRLTGLYTHFACSEAQEHSYTLTQLQTFRAAVSACGNHPSWLLHAANSAAAIDLPETHLDMVRVGLAIYGYQPSETLATKLPLRPALRVTARILFVKNMPAGSRCGYGLKHRFERDSRIGLVPIGYADGYLRCLSGKAAVRLGRSVLPVCGTISMDQIIVDLTDVPNAKVGDEVEIISDDPNAPNSVASLARLAGTIPYEITCRLGSRILRRLAA